MKTSVTYLGHIISNGEVRMDTTKVDAIKMYPRPTNVKELRSFLGLASYYRRFVKNFSQIASPLNKLLEKKAAYVWDENCEESFKKLKSILANDIVLKIPDFSQPFIVSTDASNVSVGGILAQKVNGAEKPIAYVSKSLNKTQRQLVNN